MPTKAALSFVLLPLLALPVAAQDAGAPMSAINWLSQSLEAERIVVEPVDEPPVEGGASVASVTVSALGATDGPRADAIGLMAPRVAGLPDDLWGAGRAADIANALRLATATETPQLQAFLYRLLVGEFTPPDPQDARGQTLFLARIDTLLTLGALDQALALLDRAGPLSPEIMQRWFDVALLMGEEDRVCDAMLKAPNLNPSYKAQIFCTARGGDWDNAVLILNNARALGEITEAEDALLARFLDPDLFEGEPMPVIDGPMTPLIYRLFEAVGEHKPTAPLPLAFAQADLRANIGWKAKIEAGERLARTGAVSENQLLGLYTERQPAASGGIWERVDAVQTLEEALARDSKDQVESNLPRLWSELSKAETEVPVAHIHGETLAGLSLNGDAGEIAYHMGLLSAGFETVAQNATPDSAQGTFLKALAMGAPSPEQAPNKLARAIADGFATTERHPRFDVLIKGDRLGEAILLGLSDFSSGTSGNLSKLSESITFLRSIGLESLARRASLETLILERRG